MELQEVTGSCWGARGLLVLQEVCCPKERDGGRLKSERLGGVYNGSLRGHRAWVGQGVSRHADSLELWLMGLKNMLP